MLHGDIKINHVVIGEWRAVRSEPFNGSYSCSVEWRDLRGYPRKSEFSLIHHESDGALKLSGKVLSRAENYIKL